MTPENNFIIVIGRQFGCGGRRIGKKIAERLGVNCYDKDLISEASQKNGFSPAVFAEADEKRPRFMGSVLQSFFGVMDSYAGSPLSKEGLYKAQSETIRSIAEKENCVIVGRTADYVMRDHPGLLSIFLHAPIEARAKAIVARGDAENEHEATSLAKKIDSTRENYYNFFTGRNWGYATNYHLTLDSSHLSDEMIVELIANAVKTDLPAR